MFLNAREGDGEMEREGDGEMEREGDGKIKRERGRDRERRLWLRLRKVRRDA